MSHEVAVLETKEVAITNEQKELIRKTICKDATDAEMQLFFFDCQRRGTHPLDKLIHFTKRDGKYTPVTSIDFFRLRAHSSGAYAGEGATTYELGKDGLPNACTVAVLRLVQGQLCTWRATARWDEYYPGEKSGFMWRKMPFLMLAKCAEALALRKAFPAELQGLYVKEEMDQAGPVHITQTAATSQARQNVMDASSGQEEATTGSTSNAPKGESPDRHSAPDIFAQSSAIADHEIAIGECKTEADYQRAMNEVKADKLLTSETRKPLMDRIFKEMKQLTGSKK